MNIVIGYALVTPCTHVQQGLSNQSILCSFDCPFFLLGLVLQFIQDSPIVTDNSVTIFFSSNVPLDSAFCSIDDNGIATQDCMSIYTSTYTCTLYVIITCTVESEVIVTCRESPKLSHQLQDHALHKQLTSVYHLASSLSRVTVRPRFHWVHKFNSPPPHYKQTTPFPCINDFITTVIVVH